MEKQFVPYSVAKELKILGFNEECFAEYDKNEKLIINYPHECFNGYCEIDEYKGVVGKDVLMLAPLIQQAINFCLDYIDDKNMSVIVISPRHIFISNYNGFEERYDFSFTNYNDLLIKLIELCQK